MKPSDSIFASDSPAAALRRYLIGQAGRAELDILRTYLEGVAGDPTSVQASVPAGVVDEEVRQYLGLSNTATAGFVLETIYSDHIPADSTPLFGFAAALAVDAMTDGDTTWAADWKAAHGASESQLAAAGD